MSPVVGRLRNASTRFYITHSLTYSSPVADTSVIDFSLSNKSARAPPKWRRFLLPVFLFMAVVRGTPSGVPDSLVRSANPRKAAT